MLCWEKSSTFCAQSIDIDPGVLGEINKRRNDFDSDDRTPYDAFATLPESFTNIAIKMLIDNSNYEIICFTNV